MTASRDAGLFPALDPRLRRDMDALLSLIERTFPVPARFRRALSSDALELSRLLTSARGERPLSYLNRPPLLSAYLRYFLPWNLYRICRLLPSLELPLVPGDRILDLGAGPLTLPIALWLCRPELRPLPLEFRCLDRSRAALDAGKTLFTALSASGSPSGGPPCPWIITTACGELDRHGPRPGDVSRLGDVSRPGNAGRRPPAASGKQSAALVAVLNVYNELFQPISPGDDEGLYRLARSQGALLAAHAGRKGRILIVEPGVPRSGRFIALLRDVLIGLGHPPLFPCTHIGPCPFPGPLKGAGPREFSPDSTGRQSSESGTKPKATLSRRPPPVRRNPPAGQDSGRGASKWCHFAFDTRDAPAALLRLSAAAGLSKDRATLSFLLAGPPDPDPCDSVIPGDPHPLPVVSGARGPVDAPFSPGALPSPSVSSSPGDWTPCPPLRIISDPFPLGAGGDSREWGRYGCFKGGMALVRGREPQIGSLSPGVLVRAMSAGRRDPKSGALLCRVAD